MSRKRRKGAGRGIYILPNLITTGGLLMGFVSLLYTLEGDFVRAAWAVVGAGFFDALDGRVARASGGTSRFGVEYDSLCDLVSFGVAPGLLVYQWQLASFGRFGWLAAFLYVACAALRLARFNTGASDVESKIFQGLPVPAAGGLIASTILVYDHARVLFEFSALPFVSGGTFLVLIYWLDYLMVSNIQYAKTFPAFLGRQPLNRLAGFILALTLVIWQPEVGLFFVGVTYVLSGPLGILPRARDRRRERRQEDSPEIVRLSSGGQR